MQVQGQELVDTEVVEFLGLFKDALDSWEAKRLGRLARRMPFAEEWEVLVNQGRQLFGMPDTEG